MRAFFLIFVFMGSVVNGFTQEGWQRRMVGVDTNALHMIRATVATSAEQLTVCHEGDEAGFILPREIYPRQEVFVEAVVTIQRRTGKKGWNYSGVTLYKDAQNYWMLSLVEGPDGKHTVDFLENYAGVWQAQNEAKTALKREGNVSFAWKSGTAYRLSLALRGGQVCAEICDPGDGRVLSSAYFTLGDSQAVRSATPGLIVHASETAFSMFTFGTPLRPSVPKGLSALVEGPLGRLALIDDALPGHDRAANARLAEALALKGFGVNRLTAEQFVSTGILSAERFAVLVLPQCLSLPVQTAACVSQYAREGGHVVFIGGPLLDNALWHVAGEWLDATGREELEARVKSEHRPFVIDRGFDLTSWRRSCSDKAAVTAFRVVNEGPQNSPCLRLDIANLHGWEVRQSPELPELFGEGHDFFTFLAKSGEKGAQLAVEIIERDGSRWIATADLSDTWRRVGLGLEKFRFWNDSAATRKRGDGNARLDPRQAVRVCFGMSASHTPSMVGSGHQVWLADVGTARDPLASAGGAVTVPTDTIECVYPRYKVFSLKEVASLHHMRPDRIEEKPFAWALTNLVCAIPRTEGEGFNRQGKWRFIPFAQTDVRGGAQGTCEWLLLNTRSPCEGVAFAGFGYNEPAVWSSPAVVNRIAEMAVSLRRGVFFEEAGSEQFVYWPGEPVKLGVRIRAFGDSQTPVKITLIVRKDGREVWNVSLERQLSCGSTPFEFVWQPPSAPASYTVSACLEGAAVPVDSISHEFAVLDVTPSPKDAFITAHDGDFWLGGKPWYPVGVNFWPLYVSGMDRADYWPGWLRDAYYAPALVERDLRHMRDMGINLVSIQTPPFAEYRNLLDFLRRCAKFDIHANLYMGQASPLAFDEKALKAYLTTARLPGHATVFAYDTIWEPGNHVFKNDTARAKWDAEWRAWINEAFGSVANAEMKWGFKGRRDKDDQVISPPDMYFREDGAWRVMMASYRRFMDNLTSRLWGEAYRHLRELDPNHLVSFRQGNTLPYDFALSGPVKHIDFICPEGYAIRDTDEGEDAIGFITRYVDFTTGGKPIVWSEFGQNVWDNGHLEPNPVAVEKQGRYSERFYRTALAAGADGTVPWWWVGGYREDERSDFGIIAPDRSERPAARLIREYGIRLKTPRVKAQPSVWFEFDRDAHAGGYWRAAFNEGAAAYRAASKEGKTLGVRSAGSGMDSATVPLVAIGNVPCDGTNPPKYLDAEFNFLHVLDAAGVWQEVVDGTDIVVTPGQSVRARASVGNTQAAMWLAGDGPGRGGLVTRVSGREVSRISLPDGVPYLGDATFGEFELLPAVTHPVSVSVRMEIRDRTPFGEARVFTLRSK